MKNFIELARTRKTTYEFSPKAVPDSIIKKILEAGRWAPSALNSQPYKFILVKNRKSIDGIVRSAYYGLFHTKPSAIILVALDRAKTSGAQARGMVEGKLGEDESVMSGAMPVIMMALAAEDIGVGSCILSINESKLPKSLGFQPGQRAPLAIGLGYKAKGAPSDGFTHKRKPLSELVRKERL